MGNFAGIRSGSRSFWLVAGLAVTAFHASVFSFADDEKASSLLQEAQALFAQRGDLALNDQAIARLEEASVEAQDSEDTDLRYDIEILASRAFYWKGINATTDQDRMMIFEQGMNRAKNAEEIDPGYSEGYYYFAINLGRYAEAKGIMASLGRKDELIREANTAKAKSTRQDAGGETTDGYGPDRTLGRVYFKLPWLAGGSLDRALGYLSDAYENAPELALNVVYYAEALNSGNSEQKARAKSILDQLLSSTPETYNPSRIPENRIEFEMARKLRREMGN